MKERDQLLKQSLKTGLTTDQQKCTSLRKKVIKRLRQAKANFFIDTIEEARGNGKKIWQTINKLIGRKQNHNNKYLELKINTELVYKSDHHIYRTKHLLFRLLIILIHLAILFALLIMHSRFSNYKK